MEKRKIQREEDKEKEEEEMLRADSLDETRQQLEQEKLVKKQKVELEQKLCETSSNSENGDESVKNEIEVNKTFFQFNKNEIF